MKKRNKKKNMSPDRGRRAAPPGKEQETAEDFALHLAAMFRAEFGEEEQAEPDSRREPPAAKTSSPQAAAKPENSEGRTEPFPESTVCPEPEQNQEDLLDALFDAAFSATADRKPAARPSDPALTAQEAPRVSEKTAPAASEPDPQQTGEQELPDSASRTMYLPDNFFDEDPLISTPQPTHDEPSEHMVFSLPPELSEDVQRNSTRIVLSGFDAAPFVPPQEDPSLEELFQPRGQQPNPIADTDSRPAAGAEERPAPRRENKRGWLRGVFGSGRHTQPEHSGDLAVSKAVSDDTGAYAAPQTLKAEEKNRPNEACDDIDILTAVEQEIPGLCALLAEEPCFAATGKEKTEAPAAEAPEADAREASTPAVDSLVVDSLVVDAPEADAPEADAREASAPVVDAHATQEDVPASFLPVAADVTHAPVKNAPTDHPDPFERLIVEEARAASAETPALFDTEWSDDRLFAAVDALLADVPGALWTTEPAPPSSAQEEVPPQTREEAPSPTPTEETAPQVPEQAVSPAPDEARNNYITPTPEKTVSDRSAREGRGNPFVHALFGPFGLPRAAGVSAKPKQASASRRGKETAPFGDEPVSAPSDRARPDDGEVPAHPEAAPHVPALWDPLSLFQEPEADEAPQLTPLPRDPTGTLPTLEELFGPTPEPAPAPEQPLQSVPRPARKHGWLWDLFQAPQDLTEDPEVFSEPSLSEAEAPTPDTPLSEVEAPTPDPFLTENEAPFEVPPPSDPLPDLPAAPAREERSVAEKTDDGMDFPVERLFCDPPEAARSPEPETIPMDLTEPAPANEPAPARPRRRSRRRGSPETLTLEDFLAAAVPMEQAEPPAQKQTVSFGRSHAETVSTVRENPSGLILTWSGRHRKAVDPAAAVQPPAGNAKKTAANTQQPATDTRNPAADTQKPASDLKKTASDTRKPAAAAQPPAANTKKPAEDTHTVPRGPSAAPRRSDPVPSADTRADRAEVRKTAKLQPGETHRRSPEREQDLLPPEKKSVLHPEEAYRVYARPLDEIGSHLILTGLFTILSLFFTLYLAQHWTFLPELFSGGTTVYVLLALLGLMVLVNRKLYFRDWRDEKRLRPELLIGIATFFTALDAFSAASALRPPFTVVVGALLMVALWGRYDRGLAMITTVKVLRAEQLSAGVSEVQDITKGSRGLTRTEPDVERFMDKLETQDLTERLLHVYTPVAALCGMGLTILISLWLKQDPLWTGSLIFLGSIPVTGLLAFPRLYYLLANRLSGAKAALCGYHGAEAFGGEHSILIGDDDIFPDGTLTLNGFKVYNGNPDRMIAYAAAACRSSGSALDPVFEDLLVTHNGRHYTVDNFRFYDSGGVGASIQQDVVLLGSLDFMRRMGVHMDRGARVKQAVYMSLNGELAAVFAVRYNPPENLRRGLAAIAGNRHFKGILVTRTFLGTPGFLKAKFGIPTGAFLYPSTKERLRLSEAEMKRSGAQGAILAEDSFSGFAQAAAGGRMLRSATVGAAILTVLGGLTGMVLMGVLAALPAYETATAVNLLLYTAAWLAPTLLLTAWARHF